MKKQYKVLKLHDALPKGTKVGAVIEIDDYIVASGLVESGFLEALNTHVQG